MVVAWLWPWLSVPQRTVTVPSAASTSTAPNSVRPSVVDT
jgi:hypothetical protein